MRDVGSAGNVGSTGDVGSSGDQGSVHGERWISGECRTIGRCWTSRAREICEIIANNNGGFLPEAPASTMLCVVIVLYTSMAGWSAPKKHRPRHIRGLHIQKSEWTLMLDLQASFAGSVSEDAHWELCSI